MLQWAKELRIWTPPLALEGEAQANSQEQVAIKLAVIQHHDMGGLDKTAHFADDQTTLLRTAVVADESASIVLHPTTLFEIASWQLPGSGGLHQQNSLLVQTRTNLVLWVNTDRIGLNIQHHWTMLLSMLQARAC